jgi:hypothetical protein
MDDGDEDLLAALVARRPRSGRETVIGWDTLRMSAIGAMWGRMSAVDHTVDVDAWVLRAEASR